MKILVTGGSASGKSAFAEERAVRLARESGGALCYLAAMRDSGEEARRRIERHRLLRAGKGFHTVECPVRVDQAELGTAAAGRTACGEGKPVVLLECLGNLLANEMYENGETGLTERIETQIGVLAEKCAHLIVVTDEVFSDGAAYDAWTDRYIRYLGSLNRRLLRVFQEAVEVVYGVPVYLKRPGDIERGLGV